MLENFFGRNKVEAMKSIAVIFLSIILINPNLAWADRGVSPFADLDTYIKNGKSIFIGECLPIIETNTSSFKYCRTLRVINVLQGSDKVGDAIVNVSNTPLVPGNYYLICADVDGKGAHDSWFFEQGEIEIRSQVFGETRSVKEFLLKRVLNELEGKALKEQLLIIFKHRRDDLNDDESRVKREMEVLDKALKPPNEVGTKN